jgi:hypothetical protein
MILAREILKLAMIKCNGKGGLELMLKIAMLSKNHRVIA